MAPRGTTAPTPSLAHLTAAERALLQRVKHAVHAVEPSAQVILYGSRARGDAQPDSDWDLLVLLDGEVDRTRIEAVRGRIYGVEFSEKTCPVLSTFVESTTDWNSPLFRAMPFHQNVQQEGIVL